MAKKLVLIGAGHAHLTTLKNLDLITEQGHKAIVVSADPFHYYSGMGPGMLAGLYKPAEIRFHVKKMVEDRGGTFIRDIAVKVDPDKRTVLLKSGDTISYDLVSFNTGSYIPQPECSETVHHEQIALPVKPIVNLLIAKERLTSLFEKKTPKVLVCGGGAAGVEIAANVRALAHGMGRNVEIILVAGGALLSQYDTRLKAKAVQILDRLNVSVLERDKAVGVSGEWVRLLSGVSVQCDLAIMATGVAPSPVFKNSGLPTGRDGGLLVNEFLQCTSYPDIFGGGDCISFQPRNLPKVGVYAVRQNPFLFENIYQFLEDRPLVQFIPQRKFLMILNMGMGVGLMKWKNLVVNGRIAFAIKDSIDRKFMKSFQVSGERG